MDRKEVEAAAVKLPTLGVFMTGPSRAKSQRAKPTESKIAKRTEDTDRGRSRSCNEVRSPVSFKHVFMKGVVIEQGEAARATEQVRIEKARGGADQVRADVEEVQAAENAREVEQARVLSFCVLYVVFCVVFPVCACSVYCGRIHALHALHALPAPAAHGALRV